MLSANFSVLVFAVTSPKKSFHSFTPLPLFFVSPSTRFQDRGPELCAVFKV